MVSPMGLRLEVCGLGFAEWLCYIIGLDHVGLNVV